MKDPEFRSQVASAALPQAVAFGNSFLVLLSDSEAFNVLGHQTHAYEISHLYGVHFHLGVLRLSAEKKFTKTSTQTTVTKQQDRVGYRLRDDGGPVEIAKNSSKANTSDT